MRRAARLERAGLARFALAAACAVALSWCCAAAPSARAAGVDGISDQSLPAWDRTFTASPLAAWVAQLARGPGRRLAYARYVVQWNAMDEPSGGPSPVGDYRERLEAWLADVRALGLTPVLALTSYDGRRPSDPGTYGVALGALLRLTRSFGVPVAYLEPWNEPNNQGAEPAPVAAAQADVAASLCTTFSCTVVAADIEDGPGMLSYEQSYERGLTFAPLVWGIHPYHAVQERNLAGVAAFAAALPSRARGAELWASEVGAFYCREGRLLGEAAQAGEAQFIAGPLAATFAHVFYYGLSFADGATAPCMGPGDSELFGPGDRPRLAAQSILAASAAGGWPLIGPLPGHEALAFAPLAGS